mmetsp:Transcript_43286/g.169440  ORF Transcript_43286/g.169440 Transcript_43286/m.169440 type:complete len:141 (-) Transcript_43286:1175-1597(-)
MIRTQKARLRLVWRRATGLHVPRTFQLTCFSLYISDQPKPNRIFPAALRLRNIERWSMGGIPSGDSTEAAAWLFSAVRRLIAEDSLSGIETSYAHRDNLALLAEHITNLGESDSPEVRTLIYERTVRGFRPAPILLSGPG